MSGNWKYHIAMLLGTTTIAGAVPALSLVKRFSYKKAMKGFVFPLDCWVRDEAGLSAAVSIYLRPISLESMPQPQPFKMKRIRCSEFLLSYDHAREGAEAGQGLVLQPQIQYDD
jgi:hypothetical protein